MDTNMLMEQLDSGATVVRLLESRLDASTARSVKHRLQNLIRSGHRRIALDISQVEFIDSCGLSVAVWAFKRLGDDGELVIGGVRGTVMSVFRLTRLDKVFRIFPDRERAIAALCD
jgi:anti-sigma B factor antagonist